jgi:plastocyanin
MRTPLPLRWVALIAAAGASVGLAACGSAASKDPTDEQLASGKQKFAVCSSCHALADAGSKGQTEISNVPVPDLDDAFRAMREQGFEESSIRGTVMGWIELAEPPMPRHLVKGQDAYDVAAYIASVAGTGQESTPIKALSPATLAPIGQQPLTPGSEPPHQTTTNASSTGAVPEPVPTVGGGGGGGTAGASGGAGAAGGGSGTSGGGASAGGSGASGGGGGGETLQVKADPANLAFTTTTLKAKAGKITLDFTNPSPVPHNIAVKGNGVNDGPSQTIQGGASTKLTVTLKAGTYEYYCAVPGHEEAGMKGTLTVS